MKRTTLALILLLRSTLPTFAEPPETAAERGYRWLRTKPYLPADFDQDVFNGLWKTWPRELRARAKSATLQERRQMTMDRYGLIESPDKFGNRENIIL